MFFEKIDWKMAVVFVCLVALSIGYVLNQDDVKWAIKSFLEWPHLKVSIWFSVLISFSMHYLSVRNNNSSNYEGLIFKAFGKFADSAFASATYGFALTTSVSILKGVYIQQFVGGDIYFNKFGEIDIYSLLVVCLFLIGYSLYSTSLVLVGAIFRGASKNATAIEVKE